jgi:hypothetical protein
MQQVQIPVPPVSNISVISAAWRKVLRRLVGISLGAENVNKFFSNLTPLRSYNAFTLMSLSFIVIVTFCKMETFLFNMIFQFILLTIKERKLCLL